MKHDFIPQKILKSSHDTVYVQEIPTHVIMGAALKVNPNMFHPEHVFTSSSSSKLLA